MYDFFNKVIQFLGNLGAFFIGIYDFIIYLFTEMLPNAFGSCADALAAVISTLTGVLLLDFSALGAMLGMINVFFPIAEFLTMVGAMLALLGCVMSIKWTLKIIPTIG